MINFSFQYSYWSEKGRRTELGVLELYEGDELTDKEKFDSLAATKKPVVVMQSAFIFSQGIQHMDVSETGQPLAIILRFIDRLSITRTWISLIIDYQRNVHIQFDQFYASLTNEIVETLRFFLIFKCFSSFQSKAFRTAR